MRHKILFRSLKFYYLELVLYCQTGDKTQRLNQIRETLRLNAGPPMTYSFLKTLSHWHKTKFWYKQSNECKWENFYSWYNLVVCLFCILKEKCERGFNTHLSTVNTVNCCLHVFSAAPSGERRRVHALNDCILLSPHYYITIRVWCILNFTALGAG